METFCLMLKTARPEDIFRAHGGQLRMIEAIRHGLSRYTLYALKERGTIEQISVLPISRRSAIPISGPSACVIPTP